LTELSIDRFSIGSRKSKSGVYRIQSLMITASWPELADVEGDAD
jgi:hypothetical protein